MTTVKMESGGGATVLSKLNGVPHSPLIPCDVQLPRNVTLRLGSATLVRQESGCVLGVPSTSCPSVTVSVAYAETSGVQVLLTRNEQLTNDGQAAGCTGIDGKNGTAQFPGGSVIGGGEVMGALVVGGTDVVVTAVVSAGVCTEQPGPQQNDTKPEKTCDSTVIPMLPSTLCRPVPVAATCNTRTVPAGTAKLNMSNHSPLMVCGP